MSRFDELVRDMQSNDRKSWKSLVRGSPDEPRVLANIPPNISQRRMARTIVQALLVILVVTWPFATTKLPEIGAFVPSLATALFVSDCVTAVLLFGQFSILRHWALLIIASGYSFTALTVIAHALAFPGALAPHGLMGSGLQSAVWLYWSWHSGLPLAIIGYALLKDRDRRISAHSIRLAISLSVTVVTAIVAGLFWFVTQHENLLPITFIDVRPISIFRQIVGGIAILMVGGIALYLLWVRRRSLLDQWLMVALSALLIEVALASVLSGDRYTVSWYAGRFYQLVTATILMVVLLAGMTTLSGSLARSNMLLIRASRAQRREREARLVTGDAVAATIAHEVKQPLAAMITRSETSLRWLDRSTPDLDKAKAELRQIAADGYRAGAVIESIRTNFRKNAGIRISIDVNDLIREALALARDDLQSHQISIKANFNAQLPNVIGDRIQLQQVLLNLITNAIDAMKAKDGSRVLCVEPDVRDDGCVVVSVADTGHGISPKDLERIFNPALHNKIRWYGHGPVDLPVDHRGPRRTIVGCPEHPDRRRISLCPPN
jgi:signal transduction histidine kinase